MKRVNYLYAIVFLLIAGIGTTFVAGQNNELPRLDQKPRRMRGTLPPITPASSQSDQEASLPVYRPLENINPLAAAANGDASTGQSTGVTTAMSQSQTQAGTQMRLVSHNADEDATQQNRPAVLTGQENARVPITSPVMTGPGSGPAGSTIPQNGGTLPASATLRQLPGDAGIAPANGAGSQYIGTMSVNGNGNWGSADDVPEHVFQGLGQIREQAAQSPPASPPEQNMMTLTPGTGGMPPAFEPPVTPPMHALPQAQGEPDGLVPFRPVQPTVPPETLAELPPFDSIGASQNNMPPYDSAQSDVRMTFGNVTPMPGNSATENMTYPGMPSAAVPPAQIASPEERIARSSSASVDVRYDGNSVPLSSIFDGQSDSHSEGSGLPGPDELAGIQVPQLVIEKIMPQEAQINEPMTIAINIRNTGSARAKNVVVTDRLPKGTRFVEAGASATRTENGDISWHLGDLGINEDRTVELCIVPTAEGEIGSVATATFSVDATARTRVTKPGLKMEVTTSEEEHLVGGTISLEIRISNPGTGIARNIMIEEYVPEGLSHPKGKKLAAPFGDLKPNEYKQLKLTLKCERAGEMTNYLVAKAENDLMVESKIPITVLAPALSLAIDGPKNRYLERKATYSLQVANPGSAASRDIQLVAKLPRGVDFFSTDSMGAYDPETHTVHWMLETLPSQQAGTIELVTMPREIGEHRIEFIGRAQGNLQASASHEVSVDGIASLGFEIANKVDPVELGREALYEVRVFNRGTKSSANVALRVQLPEGMRFVSAEGPTQYHVSGSIIDFNNLAQVDPRQEKTYLIRAQCLAAGDQRVVVQLQSDEMERPVTKEENTNVYGDE